MSIEARLARLERWNRFLALAVALILGGAVAWKPLGQETLRTRRLEVVDASGRVRVEVAATDKGTALTVLDTAGVPRATLSDDEDGTALYLRDGEGVTRVGVAQFAHGGGGFALHGPGAKGAAVLYLKGDGSLTFYDEGGQVRARFPGM